MQVQYAIEGIGTQILTARAKIRHLRVEKWKNKSYCILTTSISYALIELFKEGLS